MIQQDIRSFGWTTTTAVCKRRKTGRLEQEKGHTPPLVVTEGETIHHHDSTRNTLSLHFWVDGEKQRRRFAGSYDYSVTVI